MLIPIGFFGGGMVPGPFWWANADGGVGTDVGLDVAIDPSNNVIVSGYTYDGRNAGAISKYDGKGVEQWRKRLYYSTSGNPANGIVPALSGNIYIVGTYNNGSRDLFYTTKLNSAGDVQWQRTLTNPVAGTWWSRGDKIAIDSSENIYVQGRTLLNGYFAILVAKYNSSGVLQAQIVQGAQSSTPANDNAIDSAGNIYTVGRSANFSRAMLTKFNNSLAYQWNYMLNSSLGDTEWFSTTVDPSDNPIAVGESYDGRYRGIVAKYNSSGTLQWQKRLDGGSGVDIRLWGCTTDKDGNVYVSGVRGGIGLLVKYNSSGVVQWQRHFTSGALNAVYADKNGNLVLTGTISATNTDQFTIKYPQDGSKTGTYGSLTISSASNTASDNDGTSSTFTAWFGSVTMTDSSSGFTEAGWQGSSTTTQIP